MAIIIALVTCYLSQEQHKVVGYVSPCDAKTKLQWISQTATAVEKQRFLFVADLQYNVQCNTSWIASNLIFLTM